MYQKRKMRAEKNEIWRWKKVSKNLDIMVSGELWKNTINPLKIKEKIKSLFTFWIYFYLKNVKKNKCAGVMKNNGKDVNYAR